MKAACLPVLCLICLVFSIHSHGREYVIGVEEINYFPYYYMEGRDYKGFAREFYDAFGKEQGIRFRYRALPISRLYRELITGKVDFKFPDHPYWGKEQKAGAMVHYSAPIVGFIDGVMVLPERRDMTLPELKRIGCVRGFTPWPLQSHIESGDIKKSQVNSWKSVFKLAFNNRVDGAYYNVEVANAIMKRDFPNKTALVLAPNIPYEKANYHLSTLNHKAVLDELEKFSQSDVAKALREKYGLTTHQLK